MRVNHGRGFSAPAIRFARMFALVRRLEILLNGWVLLPPLFYSYFLMSFLGGKNSVFAAKHIA